MKLDGRAARPCRECKVETTTRLSRVCLKCERKRRHAWARPQERWDAEGFVESILATLTAEDAMLVTRWFGARRQFAHDVVDARVSIRSRCTTYKIPVGRWFVMVARQGGRCAICELAIHPLALCIDHDHASGSVRGLLCSSCNFGLGHLGIDGPQALARAERVVGYIRRKP